MDPARSSLAHSCQVKKCCAVDVYKNPVKKSVLCYIIKICGLFHKCIKQQNNRVGLNINTKLIPMKPLVQLLSILCTKILVHFGFLTLKLAPGSLNRARPGFLPEDICKNRAAQKRSLARMCLVVRPRPNLGDSI
jgi:hypothetical protein